VAAAAGADMLFEVVLVVLVVETAFDLTSREYTPFDTRGGESMESLVLFFFSFFEDDGEPASIGSTRSENTF
jgi:hypothetical protein